MNTDKPQYNTARDFLKIIAIIAMTADHASTVFLNEGSELYSICQFFGNFTIVIMCFFITQGLRYTRSVLKYAVRLLLWAVISEISFYLHEGEHSGNIRPQPRHGRNSPTIFTRAPVSLSSCSGVMT